LVGLDATAVLAGVGGTAVLVDTAGTGALVGKTGTDVTVGVMEVGPQPTTQKRMITINTNLFNLFFILSLHI
jgi:hypothetical protein